MKTLCHLIMILLLSSLMACKNVEVQGNDYVSSDDTEISETPIWIRFQNFQMTINGLQVNEDLTDLILTDTVYLHLESPESIEGQTLIIETNSLSDIRVEQSYETSLTIMDEGAHCDLIEWKHYHSEWKPLSKNNLGEFICEGYEESDSEIFPEFDFNELKAYVKEYCGEVWYERIKNADFQDEEYRPYDIFISRYFFRITGLDRDSGKAFSKLIILEIPMGC